MNGRQVWVTGLGVVSAAGLGAPRLLELLRAGRSGLRPLPEFDGFPGGRAPEPPRAAAARHLDRSARLFLAAAEEAWGDAGLEENGFDPRGCALIEGSSLGPLADLLTADRARLAEGVGTPARLSRHLAFMTGAGGAAFALLHGIRGPVWHLSAGSVSGMAAIGEGYQKIKGGAAEIVVAGGTECPLHVDVLDTFRAAGILAKPAGTSPACQPFDARRNGTILGDGAGVLILESSDHACRRRARPRAVVAGFGFASEAHSMTAPHPEGNGVAEAARQATQGMAIAELGWILAHGTGTKQNDAAECRGLASVLGDRLNAIPLTALKPTLGHCLGASGAVEAAAALLALEAGMIPATLGTKEIDPALPPCDVVTRVRTWHANSVLLLAESFGGRCAALTLTRP